MPLYDFQCNHCQEINEVLVTSQNQEIACAHCGSSDMTKLMAAHSSASGPSRTNLPGPGDTGCCGHAPGQASGCAGPGSCCGANF